MKDQEITKRTDEFKVPQGYFEKLDLRISERVILDDLRLKQNDGYKVPDNYFVNFKVKKPESRLIRMFPPATVALWTTAAAAVVILFLIWNPSSPLYYDTEGLSSSSLDEYFETQDIQDYLSLEEVSAIENNTNILKPTSISDDLIFDEISKDILVEELEPMLVEN